MSCRPRPDLALLPICPARACFLPACGGLRWERASRRRRGAAALPVGRQRLPRLRPSAGARAGRRTARRAISGRGIRSQSYRLQAERVPLHALASCSLVRYASTRLASVCSKSLSPRRAVRRATPSTASSDRASSSSSGSGAVRLGSDLHDRRHLVGDRLDVTDEHDQPVRASSCPSAASRLLSGSRALTGALRLLRRRDRRRGPRRRTRCRRACPYQR